MDEDTHPEAASPRSEPARHVWKDTDADDYVEPSHARRRPNVRLFLIVGIAMLVLGVRNMFVTGSPASVVLILTGLYTTLRSLWLFAKAPRN